MLFACPECGKEYDTDRDCHISTSHNHVASVICSSCETQIDVAISHPSTRRFFFMKRLRTKIDVRKRKDAKQ